MTDRRISLADGGGGLQMNKLIDEIVIQAFNNPILNRRDDQAQLPVDLVSAGERIAFTTDSFVVSPLTFPGGNIGTLAVNGTLNDLAVGGATPRAISCALLIEEGLPVETLRHICQSMAGAADLAGVAVVTGDTKVLPRGKLDQLYINTSGIGLIPEKLALSAGNIRPGDRIIVSGQVGNHGAAIMALRSGIGVTSTIHSDCRSLTSLCSHIRSHPGLKAMRDPTRGGLAAVLYEFAEACQCTLRVDEQDIPVSEPVRALCELLGLDPLHLACEGRLVAVVGPDDADAMLSKMRAHIDGEDARIIGVVQARRRVGAILCNTLGVECALPPPQGELLPRIC